jgi:hypothetical protein
MPLTISALNPTEEKMKKQQVVNHNDNYVVFYDFSDTEQEIDRSSGSEQDETTKED